MQSHSGESSSSGNARLGGRRASRPQTPLPCARSSVVTAMSSPTIEVDADFKYKWVARRGRRVWIRRAPDSGSVPQDHVWRFHDRRSGCRGRHRSPSTSPAGRARPGDHGSQEFLGARFDAGLAWVHFAEGSGGLGCRRAAGPGGRRTRGRAARRGRRRNETASGWAWRRRRSPRSARRSSSERFLRPLFTAEHIYCQLFSEPGAGSDLAAVATRAVRDGDDWVVNGQKVWTSGAQNAQMAILVARTDPDVPKHAGLSYFLLDMTVPGVDIRPLRQITGEAEFNEVFLTDVRVPDANRLGAVGQGWRVATTTLNNERVAIGGGAPREGGMIGKVAEAWRSRPEVRDPAMHDKLMRLWVDAEVTRLTGARLRQQLADGQPGPEGLGDEAGVRTAGPGDLGLRPRAGRRGRSALRRLDDAPTVQVSTSPDANPATGTCARRATRSRAAPRRSCATSSPNACSDCRPNTASTRTSPGRTCPDDRPPTCCTPTPRRHCATSVRGLFADRLQPAAVAAATTTPSTDFAGLWKTLAVELGVAGLLVARGRSAGRARPRVKQPSSWRRSGARSRRCRSCPARCSRPSLWPASATTETLRPAADGATTAALAVSSLTIPRPRTRSIVRVGPSGS